MSTPHCKTCYHYTEGCQRTEGQHCCETTCRRTGFSYWEPRSGVEISAARLRPLLAIALHDFQQCSYWPPISPDEVYECRSECPHRWTCQMLYAIVQGQEDA